MRYLIQVSEHFVKVETPSVEYVRAEKEATSFDTVLEAAEAAEENRVSGYLVVPCPQS